MQDQYDEVPVKSKDTMKAKLLRVALILAAFVSLFIGQLSSWLFIVPVAVILFDFWYIPRLKFEWEYIYCDGQIDFDKIMGGAKRKTILRIDIENAEIVAPTPTVKTDYHRDNIVVKDFTSLDPNVKTYSAIVNQDGKTMRVDFEPSEKMLKLMKQKYPRKVKEY